MRSFSFRVVYFLVLFVACFLACVFFFLWRDVSYKYDFYKASITCEKVNHSFSAGWGRSYDGARAYFGSIVKRLPETPNLYNEEKDKIQAYSALPAKFSFTVNDCLKGDDYIKRLGNRYKRTILRFNDYNYFLQKRWDKEKVQTQIKGTLNYIHSFKDHDVVDKLRGFENDLEIMLKIDDYNIQTYNALVQQILSITNSKG